MNPSHVPTLRTRHALSRRRVALAAIITIATVAIGSGCSSSSRAASADSVASTSTAAVVDESSLQSALDALVDLGVPGVVLAVSEGDEAVTLTAGVSDLDTGTSMSPAATFRIASMTKPYTATVVLQLVDEGVLRLDDTVEQWLPDIVADGDRITVRDLLHHTSGVAEYFEDPAVLQPYLEGDYDYVWTPRQLIEIADDLGATSQPGTEWSYSNTNYAIVGLIVEAATGRTLGDEMQTRIFDELDLEHTTFAVDTTLDPNIARGYLMGGDAPVDVTGVYPFPWGAGNIVSDAADAATFSRALFEGSLLPPALLGEMLPGPDDDVQYGLGVMAWSLSCGMAYGHDGGFAGYSTRALFHESGRQVVILANSITLDDHLASDPAADSQWASIIESAVCG